MNARRPRISFVVAPLSRSGGSRVTVEMANGLLQRGYRARILCGKRRRTARRLARTALLQMRGVHHQDWGRQFEGRLESFSDLNEVCFDDAELVVAVGTDAIPLVRALQRRVTKVRYCHGFSFDRPAVSRDVWSGPMPTMAVSSTLIPQLQAYGCKRFIGVVPNGIRTDSYYQEGGHRDGIGMVFGAHYSKAPEDCLRLISLIMKHWPDVPLHVFGGARRPRAIPRKYYHRYPSVAKARQLYNRSKVWLMVSRAEGFGMPMLEAMACGAAFVGTDTHGCTEVVSPGRNGILVPVGEPEAFLEPIDLLLTNETRRRQLVKEGSRTVERYGWDRAVTRMEAVMKALRQGEKRPVGGQEPSISPCLAKSQ